MTRERTHYFAGQLLSADDLAQEQLYFLDKARRHNRTLHGWGVVCGLAVEPGPGRLEVRVGPGYALDPNGDEIVIDSEIVVDLCSEDRRGNAIRPCESADEASLEVVERLPGQQLYVAVRYAQCYTGAVPARDGGTQETIDYSRVRETFSIAALSELPATYCGASAGEPWVVLADVTVGSHLDVAKIDSVTHRRWVDRAG